VMQHSMPAASSTNIDLSIHLSIHIHTHRDDIDAPFSYRIICRGLYNFVFDGVLDAHAAQSDVFDEVSSMVESVLDGYRVCIMAYGQTGSGKTYTMEGPPSFFSPPPLPSGREGGGQNMDCSFEVGEGEGVERSACKARGIIPRSVELLFDECHAREAMGWQYSIQVSYLEIYNEHFRDLLDHRFAFNKQMDIKTDARTGLPHVTNLMTMDVLDANAVYSLLARANKARTTAATESNLRSSRSHAMFALKVRGHNPRTGQESEGNLNLVDLAGAERLSTSNTALPSPYSWEEQQQQQKQLRHQQARQKETQNINKSLSLSLFLSLALQVRQRETQIINKSSLSQNLVRALSLSPPRT